jgi:YhcH/YjgK/YiaL family protein
MIKDCIANIDLYSKLSERLSLALHYLEFVGTADFGVETVEISGTDVYAMHQVYTTRPAAGRLYENHNDHIDIQFVLEGSEIIRVTDVGDLSVTKPYNAESDATLYAITAGTDVKLGAGDFVILFPHDAHVPQLESGSPGDVKKIVIKVRV